MPIICHNGEEEILVSFNSTAILGKFAKQPIRVETSLIKQVYDLNQVEIFINKYCEFIKNKNCKLSNKNIEMTIEGNYINVINKRDSRKIKIYISDDSHGNLDNQISTIIVFIGTDIINNYSDWNILDIEN